MTDRSLRQPIDTTGEWYLPENPDRKISGSLSYSLEQILLHLNDTFSPISGDIVASGGENYPLIHGITRERDAVTLINAQRIGFQFCFGTGGMGQSASLLTSVLLVGAHLPANFTFPEMRCRIPGLQVWLSRLLVSRNMESDGSLTMRLTPVPAEITPIPSIAATFSWEISCNTGNSLDPTSIEVTSSGWLCIKPEVPQPIEWFLEQINRANTLLSFLAGTTMSADCINASIGNHHNVSVMVPPHNAKYCTYTKLMDFYISRGVIGGDFARVVARWYEIYPSVDNPSQLALSIFSSKDLWVHVEFLSLIQALEGFHRAQFEGNYMDADAYESVRSALGNAIPASLSSDHKDSLQSRIRYGNQIALRKRLNELAELLDISIRRLVFGGDGNIPRTWIDTRNYYTHWDEELRANILDGQGMYNANVRLGHFIRALYMQLVGIPSQTIQNALCNTSGPSQHLAQLNNPNAVLGTVLRQDADINSV